MYVAYCRTLSNEVRINTVCTKLKATSDRGKFMLEFLHKLFFNGVEFILSVSSFNFNKHNFYRLIDCVLARL